MNHTPLVLPENWNSVCSSDSGITVATFNTLRRNYEFDDEHWLAEEYKNWDYRLSLLKKIFGSINADLVGVQEAEVDTIEEDFSFMKEFGYELLKGKAKEKDEHPHTKPSLFFKSSKFKHLWSLQRCRTLLSLFQDNYGHHFFVIVVHLQGGGNHEDQRCFQLRSALQQLQIQARNLKIQDQDLCGFVCGDFNADPHQIVHQLLRNGKLTDNQVIQCFGKPGFKYQHPYQFEDSYEKVTSRPFSFEGPTTDAIYLDYVYFTPRTIELICVRDPLSEKQRKELEATRGLPCEWNPSDHLPLVGLFKLKDSEKPNVEKSNCNKFE